jgi:hypothetical protein
MPFIILPDKTSDSLMGAVADARNGLRSVGPLLVKALIFLMLSTLLNFIGADDIRGGVFAEGNARYQAPPSRSEPVFPEVVHSTNKPGIRNDMLDVFEALLDGRKILDPEGRISVTLDIWRKTPEVEVHFTRDEANQVRSFLDHLCACPDSTAQERAENIARAIDYKMQYELQEAWERMHLWTASPEEIIARIRNLDISKYGRIIGVYPGSSKYVVIVINQFHRGLSENVEPEVVAVQREIAAIENALIDGGICNVLALEGSESKEIALELAEPPRAGQLVEFRHYLECIQDADNPLINDLLAGNYGASLWQEAFRRYVIHTFGVETPQVHDKAATFNLLAKELVGALRDLSFFGEEGFAFVGEAEQKNCTRKSFPKTGLIYRLETTLKSSGAASETVQQAVQVLDQAWQSQANITTKDLVRAANEVQDLAWEFSIGTRNLFFPLNIEQIRTNTLTNAIIFLVGVFHNRTGLEEEAFTLTDTFLDHNISHVVIQPHTVQAILDRQG